MFELCHIIVDEILIFGRILVLDFVYFLIIYLKLYSQPDRPSSSVDKTLLSVR